MVSLNRNARELLAFYRDAGVDALLGDEAIDRFADEFDRPAPKAAAASPVEAFPGEQAPPSPSLARKGGGGRTRAPPAVIAAAPPSAEAAVMSARAAAKGAESLEALRALL